MQRGLVAEAMDGMVGQVEIITVPAALVAGTVGRGIARKKFASIIKNSYSQHQLLNLIRPWCLAAQVCFSSWGINGFLRSCWSW